MIPLKQQAVLKQRFARELNSRVRIDFFSQKPSAFYVPGRQDCAACEDVSKLLRELAGLNLRISLTQHDIDDDAPAAAEYGIDRVPAMVLRGQNNRPLRYFGNPTSRQFMTFVELLLLTARRTPNLQPETVKTLRKLRSDVTLKVFVTPACTHSPVMALVAARMAMQSPHVKLDLIDVTQFPDLIGRFYVRVTPLTLLNDRFAVPAVMDEATLANNVLLAGQGKGPSKGGDHNQMTPVPQQQPQQKRQQPRHSSSGLILPR